MKKIFLFCDKENRLVDAKCKKQILNFLKYFIFIQKIPFNLARKYKHIYFRVNINICCICLCELNYLYNAKKNYINQFK